MYFIDRTLLKLVWPWGHQRFFTLNSAEYDIYLANKYENTQGHRMFFMLNSSEHDIHAKKY